MLAGSPTRRSSRSSGWRASMPPSSTWSTPATTCTMYSSRLWRAGGAGIHRLPPIVRPPGFDPAFILRLLDMGVQGIQVPHVSSAETAREAVQAVRYPPLGERGMAAGSRAADYGRIPLVEHMAQSNREILLACMIEDMAAVEQIDEIAAVEGVDLLAVGPSDLSCSLGVGGQPDNPRLVAAIARVREAVKKGAGARLALPLNHAAFPRNAAQLKVLGAGYSNCAPTPEARLLRSMQEQCAAQRKLLG